MSDRGYGKIAWQKGALALYAACEVSMTENASGGLVVENEDFIPDDCRSGLFFAISLLSDPIAKKFGHKNMTITVSSFDGMPCDTTATAVAYVVFIAITDLLDLQTREMFLFDEVTGAFKITHI